MNGSVGLSVIGFGAFGSGSLMILSSRWFCQKQSRSADHEREHRDHDPRAQLVEVLDERQPVVVAYRPLFT